MYCSCKMIEFMSTNQISANVATKIINCGHTDLNRNVLSSFYFIQLKCIFKVFHDIATYHC